jgi:hypothetical protein
MLQNYPVTQAEHESVENWPRVFDEYGVQFLVLDRHDDTDLLDLFRSQPGWTLDFEDEEAHKVQRTCLLPFQRFCPAGCTVEQADL